MLEQIMQYLSNMDVTYIYLVLFFFSFVENVFPPSPSDIVIILGSSLIASTGIEFVPILISTSIFSALGFVFMYYVGRFFGEKIINSGKLKFLDITDLNKTDSWFNKYGYYLIVANRFLPGTRSVISFFAGVHKLKIGLTFLAAAISAFLWNFIIIYVGYLLGNNIKLIDRLLTTYSQIVILITCVIALLIVIRFYIKRKKKNEII
ncbi:MAG: DedA family protein [bacterium]